MARTPRRDAAAKKDKEEAETHTASSTVHVHSGTPVKGAAKSKGNKDAPTPTETKESPIAKESPGGKDETRVNGAKSPQDNSLSADGPDGADTKPAVVFFHPDLGIGGAERLVVDAAVGLQNRGRRVVIFTSHCDPGHCFEEARDGTLDVRVRGNLLPATLGGRFKILLTILRHYHVLLSIALSGELRRLRPEAFFADQLSAGLPFLRFLYPNVRILFYCHFPDLLLVQRRRRWLTRLWRLPFDALEGWSMRGADRIVVNSAFTKKVVQSVWPGLGGSSGLGIVYPCVDVQAGTREAIRGFPRLWGGKKVVLSINRFERKKDVGLAIRAFAQLNRRTREGAKLIIAGGYDDRERENVAYHAELIALAEELGLSTATAKNTMSAGGDAAVLFLLSVPAPLKDMLLKTATLLLYTPANEHFGIVPLEAMLAGVPVLATSSGGPLETVDDGATGWLRDPEDVDAWSGIMAQVLKAMPAAELEKMGAAGRERVVARFAETTMAADLDAEIRAMQQKGRARTLEIRKFLHVLTMYRLHLARDRPGTRGQAPLVSKGCVAEDDIVVPVVRHLDTSRGILTRLHPQPRHQLQKLAERNRIAPIPTIPALSSLSPVFLDHVASSSFAMASTSPDAALQHTRSRTSSTASVSSAASGTDSLVPGTDPPPKPASTITEDLKLSPPSSTKPSPAGADQSTKPAPLPPVRRASRSRKQSLPLSRSATSDVEDKSLTSFPSLSPEASPHTPRSSRPRALTAPRDALGSSPPPRTGNRLKDGKREGSRLKDSMGDVQDFTGDSLRRSSQPTNLDGPIPTPVTARRAARPSMVDVLTRHSPSFRTGGRQALFDESPTTSTTASSVPGNIHATDDTHIERMIARTGAVALVRQLAEDLALREMEVSTIRRTADARERELKKMLKEVDVSSLDIEQRLRKLDHSGVLRTQGGTAREGGGPHKQTGLDDLMREAIGDELGSDAQAEGDEDVKQATIRADPPPLEGDGDSRRSSIGGESGKGKGWKGYIWTGSAADKPDRPKSTASHRSGVTEERSRAESSAGARRRGLDEALFQPPPVSEDAIAGDDSASTISKREKQSGSASWTSFFGGKSQGPKSDTASTTRGKSDSSSKSSTRDASQSSTRTTSSAQAALLNIKESNASMRKPRKPPAPLTRGPTATKHLAPSSQSLPPGSPASLTDTTNYGPVEMDAILPAGTRPPTLSPGLTNINDPMEPLTDRFGFIYDQRRRKKESETFARVRNKPRVEVLSSSKDSGGASGLEEPPRPDSPASTNSKAEGRRWQDYLKIATFPTELLAHTPASSSAILTLGNADMQESLKRSAEFDDQPTPTSGANVPPSASAVTARPAEIVSPTSAIPVRNPQPAAPAQPPPANDLEPVKLLLTQLAELHDALQRDKEFKWNEFLRKVRAERRTGEANTNPDHAPEAALAAGEVIGIATLGHQGKLGRAKWKEFKTLVLGGIPVAYRGKIWGECSGAAMLRVPGYYADLVAGPGEDDAVVTAQIAADIRRTLTDNVFFRAGPGVARLDEVLSAYARRNPEVGYCQGMNLIAASLLLILPTAEDAFWVLCSMVEHILPRHYYDHSLLASRADQQVLRSYVAELLPKLSAHLLDLAVDLEALTFQWFLSLFTACLSAEALYRVWDVLLCSKDEEGHGGSTFLFQVALALLKLNEPALLACQGPAEVYAYLGDSITNHAISIDGLIAASDGLRQVVRRADVEERRARCIERERETMRERDRIRNARVDKAAEGKRHEAELDAREPLPVEG